MQGPILAIKSLGVFFTKMLIFSLEKETCVFFRNNFPKTDDKVGKEEEERKTLPPRKNMEVRSRGWTIQGKEITTRVRQAEQNLNSYCVKSKNIKRKIANTSEHNSHMMTFRSVLLEVGC